MNNIKDHFLKKKLEDFMYAYHIKNLYLRFNYQFNKS